MDYLVSWEIDIEADNAIEAAHLANRVMKEQVGPVFSVIDENFSVSVYLMDNSVSGEGECPQCLESYVDPEAGCDTCFDLKTQLLGEGWRGINERDRADNRASVD